MAEKTFDVIVVGALLFGASVAEPLVREGKKVLLLDANEKHHTKGSSHGRTRIYRELDSETQVFYHTASDSKKMIYKLEPVKGNIVRNMPAVFMLERGSQSHRKLVKNAEDSKYKLEEIGRAEATKLGLKINDSQVGYIDRNAATIDPHNLLDALYARIKILGGEIKFNTPITAWETSSSGVKVTSGDSEISAKQLVIASGGWTPEVLRMGNADAKVTKCLAEAMRLERIPVFYFDCPEKMADVIPALITDAAEVDPYAMPEIGPDRIKMLKMGYHKGQVVENPSVVKRTIDDDEKKEAVTYMEKLTGKKLELKDAAVCLYAIASDTELPIVGIMPSTFNIFLATYGGGICAKHALALGKALSNMMQGKAPGYEMDEFSASRLTKQLRVNSSGSEISR